MKTTITQATVDAMIADTKRQLPNEGCGYVAGITQAGVAQIDTIYPMTNVDQSPEHFSFDPKEQFAVLKQARNAGKTLLGVYHSHPETPARLSEEDLALLNDPAMIYIIISFAGEMPEMAAFKIKKDEETVITVLTLERV